ncbi:flavin reductase family protein [Allomuricauda sp. SCSIO 65647]|uniref:flavin reductase family protein n=1 Tax=Allomuricauda sp. SCSIO 65647 TaxID=2908843 RepID=UPI001F3E4C48|nr:flavin reductase family protein [Muricauda sp. SCSIO 65647]UJH68413.1 flavin reductase family protein [Muricauda sp. SCSIO 65647]
MESIKTVTPKDLSQPDLHSILLSAVAPRPICFASTIDKKGNVNLSPFSFFNVFSSNPPLMIFSPARSGRDNSTKHSYQNVKEVPEVVINIVNHPMVEQMSLASTAYEKGTNEFIKAGFAQVPSEKVGPPRVGEAPVSFECKVTKIIELAELPGAGNLIFAEVVLIHINEKYLDEQGGLDTTKLDLVGRMGGSWYTRSSGDSLFEIPKPIRTKGIGVDQLPEGIRESEILTGNNLGRLGNVEKLPTETEIENAATLSAAKGASTKRELHQVAKEQLEAGETELALAVLLYAEKID